MLTLQARELTVGARIEGVAVSAIRALSFDLARGTILGLVGESGAGKTMVGRAIAQLLPPAFTITAGSLLFEGKDLLAMAAAQRRALLGRAIAFIPQAPITALNPVKTIGAQFDEHLARLGQDDRKIRRERALAMLAAARLSPSNDLLTQYPHQLSGGMCQRVLIALAFASNPRLVIADEPTTALDVTTQPPILRLIADMQRRHGTAVIFITHDLRLAARLCDELIVMYAGRAVECGRAREVLATPAHPYTRCLQLANPSMQCERRTLYVMPDQVPGLLKLQNMSGCRFAPRCPLALDGCREAEPPQVRIAAGRNATCFRTQCTPDIETVPDSTAAPARSGRHVLRVEKLRKEYETGPGLWRRMRAVAAVKEASFEPPTAGRILFSGEGNPAGRSRAARAMAVQMVFQDPQSALNPRRRVASIVTQAMEAGSRHVHWDERLKRTRKLLAEVGLAADFAARLPGQLSGGQRQRVNIARALCNVPKVLIADEIASGLDVSIQAQLLSLLARLRSELGFAMLFISHDLSVVRHLCSRVLVMYRGEIVEQGPIEMVFAHPQHPHTRALLSAAPPEATW